MGIFINRPQQSGQLLEANKVILIASGLGMYAKCDQNIPCGSRVMNILTNW